MRTFVYVSNADDGTIGIYSLSAGSGELRAIGAIEAGAMVMPMAVSPNKKHLYASIRSKPFHVATFAIDAATGGLTLRGTAPLANSMCSIAVDATGRYLLSASYGGSIASVNPIDADGVVTSGPSQSHATGDKAHAIITDRSNRFVFVPNLGSDQVMQYRFDAANGQLTANAPPLVLAAAGDGPRHIVTSPDNKFVYVLCELTGQVIQLALDQATGTLTTVSRVPSAPPNAGLSPGKAYASIAAQLAAPATGPVVWAADIQITPDGRFLYTTERTTSTIALFHVAPTTGGLTYIGHVPTEQQPRGIRIDARGNFLVASGEKSDHIAVFKIDRTDGTLSLAARTPTGRGSNWIEIVDFT